MKNVADLGFTVFAGVVSLGIPTMAYLTLFG